ncbi:MAG: NAD(P)H-dependent flavin oxidoreductase [Methyloceanibacter sp.]
MNGVAPGTLKTQVCGLLGCDYPVILAGMGGVARSELALAVTRAGGFGFLGMVRESPELIRSEVETMRRGISKPFGVNIIPAATAPDLLEAQVKTCIELQVPVIALFWNLRPDLVQRFRDAGIVVVCQVGSKEEGRAAEDAGAQVLIAQGVEAGGHVRGTTPLHTLLSELVPASSLPVLAAGGMVDGRDLVESLRRGAQGIVIGTAFIAAPESFAHDYHRRRTVEASTEDTILTDIFHINWPIRAPVRVLKNSATRGDRGDPFGPPRIIGDEAGRSIYLFSTDSPSSLMTGDFEAMALYAGEGVDRITRIMPAGERVATIVLEAACMLESGAEATQRKK